MVLENRIKRERKKSKSSFSASSPENKKLAISSSPVMEVIWREIVDDQFLELSSSSSEDNEQTQLKDSFLVKQSDSSLKTFYLETLFGKGTTLS